MDDDVGGLDDDWEYINLGSKDEVKFEVTVDTVRDLSKFVSCMMDWDSPMDTIPIRGVHSNQLSVIVEYINHFDGKYTYSLPPNDMNQIERINYHLKHYYQSLNKEYDNLFIEYCEDNGYEVEDVEEEINDESAPDDSVLIEFDDDFPFKTVPNDDNQREKIIFDILLKASKNEFIAVAVRNKKSPTKNQFRRS